ncbi:MAG TPA: TRAP transporter substrate-binding protein [Candidatus Elarobacter sp.]|nr:TRAP transporter substrate-binding protein [Candidatus Elarobacter sp.]
MLRWPGEAAQYTLKLGNDQTPTHPMTVATADAVKRIAEASHGQIEVRVFPNSQLGGDQQMLQQLRSGALEMMQLGNNILGGVVPAAALLSVPFAFKNAQQYQAAANGPLGAYLGAAAAKIGMRKFETAFYGGFFETQNRVRPINAPADFAGLKIRVPAGPLDVSMFKALGASPTVLNLSEVYTSLQTHIVDGIEVPLPTVRNFKFYEQVKYCSLTHHSGLAYMLFINNDVWAKLPKPMQEVLDREFNAAAAAASRSMAAQESSIETELTSDGMVFNRPALEPFAQVMRTAGFYATMRNDYGAGAWEMLEKTTGKLT